MDINDLCRTCLSVSENIESLYETCVTSTHICYAEMLSTFTPFICFETDGYPTTICHNCITELNRCYAFRVKCLESDEVLRNHVIGIANKIATTTSADKNTALQCSDTTNATTKSLDTPMIFAKTHKDLNEELDFRNDEIVVKIEMEDDITASSTANQQAITKVSAVFNNSPNKTKCEENSTSVIAVLHCPDVTNAQSSGGKVLGANLNLIKIEEIHPNFEEVFVKRENLENLKITRLNSPQGSIKDPLTTAEIQEVMDQELDLVKHEVNLDIKFEKVEDVQEREKLYSCTDCHKSYRKRQNLQIHMRTHTGEKPYTCSICNNSYRQRQNLTIHMRTHTGEKPYSCTVCTTSFGHKQSLKFHMWTHAGEKPYPCTFCDSSFKTKQHLTYHMRTHTGEKSYSCKVCDMSFGHTHNLKMHLRTHTGEQPYSCTVCNSSFKTKRILTIHKRKHTGEKS